MFRKFQRTTLLAATAFYFTISPLQAADLRSDILGLSITQTQDEAANVVRSKFGNSPIIPLTITLTSGDYQQKSTLGFAVDINQGQQNKLSPDLIGFDRVRVYFDPNQGSSKIIGITRFTNYGYQSKTVFSTMESSLIEKYGQPTDVYNYGNTGIDYLWSLSPGSYRKNGCVTISHGLNSQYFYETRSNESYGAESTVNEVSSRFLEFFNAMNYPDRAARLHQVERCGGIIIASIQMSNGYVTQIEEKELDLTGAIPALFLFHSAFSAEVTKKQNQHLQNDAGNKPHL